MREVPEGWVWSTLQTACAIVRGITFPATAKQLEPTETNVCCLRTSNIQKHIDWKDVYYVDRSYVKREDQFVQPGDVLMSMANSYELVGKVAKVLHVPSPTAFGAFLSAVRPTPAVNGSYLFHFLRTDRVQSELREGSSQTTNIANISVGRLSSIAMPLAPATEQARIANQLDTLLTRIQSCNDRFDAIPALLKRFRQAVLDAATLGVLTAGWREANGGDYEWKDVQLSEIAEVQGGVTKDAKKQSALDEEVPYLRVANVQRGYIDLTEVKTIRVSQTKLKNLLLEEGDVLFNEGGDLDKLGRGWVWDGQIPRCTFQNHVFRARLFDRENQPKFVSWWGNSRGLEYFIRSGKQTTNLASINKRMLAALPIRLPSAAEQTEIVSRVEAFFTLADRLEARATAARIKSQRLTPLVLAKAFRGELVPQDPSDEHASALLVRLKSQRPDIPRKASHPVHEMPKRPTKMTNIDKESVKAAILKLKNDRFSFDELRNLLTGDYESLKTALFELLEEPSPVVRQVFNKKLMAIQFEKVGL